MAAARKPKPRRKALKGGPAGEQPVVARRAQASLDQQLLKRDRETKATFYAAHKDGMDALKRRDLPALEDAIDRERRAINQHARLIERRRRK